MVLLPSNCKKYIIYHAPYYNIDQNAAFIDNNRGSVNNYLISGGTYNILYTLETKYHYYTIYIILLQKSNVSIQLLGSGKSIQLLEYTSYPLREAEQVELAWPLHLSVIRASLPWLDSDQLTDRTLWRLPQLTLTPHG